MTLAWIIAASLAGGALSVGAASFALVLRAAWVPMLVSYAIGALLLGIVAFFVLEKLLLWRHCHTENCEAHDPQGAGGSARAEHDRGRSGTLIVVGHTVHNFVDGVLIAAAFMQSTPLGVITTLAIVAHEIPQELGDFLILLHSGYSRAKALALNLLSSAATLVGGALGYFGLQLVAGWQPALLGVVAASMIYIAVADLIPGLHKRPELGATAAQASLIGLGIATIAVARGVIERIV